MAILKIWDGADFLDFCSFSFLFLELCLVVISVTCVIQMHVGYEVTWILRRLVVGYEVT